MCCENKYAVKGLKTALRDVLRPIWYKYSHVNRKAQLDGLAFIIRYDPRTYHKRTISFLAQKAKCTEDDMKEAMRILSIEEKLIYLEDDVVLKSLNDKNKEFNDHVRKTKNYKINRS